MPNILDLALRQISKKAPEPEQSVETDEDRLAKAIAEFDSVSSASDKAKAFRAALDIANSTK